MNLRKFNKYFEDEDKCRRYLYKLKWKKGFCCRRCGCKERWTGRTKFHLRCQRCNYDESVTAHTVFHKIQFPLLKAFTIVFHHTVYKKSLSSRNLAEVVGVDPKTVLSFCRKLRDAMGTYLSDPSHSADRGKRFPLDSIIITNRGEKLNGLQRMDLSLSTTSAQGRSRFHITGAKLPSDEIDPCQLQEGRYTGKQKSVIVWNFKSWLTGVHHHCSEKHMQGYLNEFSYKYCLRSSKEHIWHNIIEWMTSGNQLR